MNNVINLAKAARLIVLKDIHRRHLAQAQRIDTNMNQNQNQKIKVYRAFLFNEDWGLYTVEAYKEWFTTLSIDEVKNLTREVEYVTSLEDVITIDDLNEEANNL